jgi:hypothetical protein
MAKPVTALLYVDKEPKDSNADESQGSGFVWWWTKGGNMHVHDVHSNNTMTKFIPTDQVSAKSVVRVLVLDTSQRWVWAGHDDGCVSTVSPVQNITTSGCRAVGSYCRCLRPTSWLRIVTLPFCWLSPPTKPPDEPVIVVVGSQNVQYCVILLVTDTVAAVGRDAHPTRAPMVVSLALMPLYMPNHNTADTRALTTPVHVQLHISMARGHEQARLHSRQGPRKEDWERALYGRRRRPHRRHWSGGRPRAAPQVDGYSGRRTASSV